MSVIKDERLTSLEKLLLIHIVSFCKKKDYCWATNKYFCDIYKVSRQTISKSINNLAKLDYIRSNYTRTNINASKRKIMLSDRYKEQIKSIKDNLNTGIKL
jgi:SOS-response transcriptional repressor LexA